MVLTIDIGNTKTKAAVFDGSSILNETLSVSGQLLVKLFGRESYEYDRYEKANHRMIKLNIRESMAGRNNLPSLL